MTDPDRNMDEQVARYLERARERVGKATFHDVMSFLKVSDVAPGSHHARFQKLFSKGEDSTSTGLQALIEVLKQEASSAQDVSGQLDRDLVRLIKDARGHSPDTVEDLRAIAAREFDAHYGSSAPNGSDEDHPGDVDDAQVRALMVAVARSDETVAHLLAERYHHTDALYADRYEVLMATLGRQPLPVFSSYRDFAQAIASVMSGFLTRAAIERDKDRARELFTAIIVPLIGAITYPVGSEPPSDENSLFSDTTASATRNHLRTPSEAIAVPPEDLADIVGTWQGTQYVDPSVRTTAPIDLYLTIDTSDGILTMATYTLYGVSRMLAPTFTALPGGRRLSCMYEAERANNPRPDYPSHRGAWVLETNSSVTELQATYFNDRGSHGRCVFTSRRRQVVKGFMTAEALFATQEPTGITSADGDPSEQA